MASRYCSTTSASVWGLCPMRAGQPPQHIASASDASDASQADGLNAWSNRPASDTAPDESPRSHSVMVLMSSRAILPAPLWVTESFAGMDDPVRMNIPRSSPTASTARRAASHTEGTSCHSSTTCGREPCSARLVSASTSILTFGSSRWTALSPKANAVHDLPHHFGPRTSTAPKVSKALRKRSSMMRGRYAAGFSVPYSRIETPPSLPGHTVFSRKIELHFRGNLHCVFEGFCAAFSKWSSIGRQGDSVCGRPRLHEEDARHRDAPAPNPLRRISEAGPCRTTSCPKRGAYGAPHDARQARKP